MPEDVLSDVTQIINEKHADEIDMNIILGKLLYSQDDYEKYLKYFLHLLDVYRNNKSKDHNLAKTYHSIAWTCLDLEKDDDAILYFSLVFDQYLSLNNQFDAARMLYDIGTCYIKKKDYDEANNYLTKSYKMKKDDIDLPNNHCQIALSMNGFGTVCYYQNDYEHVLDYYIKSLNSYENSSLLYKCKNHDNDISRQYKNIGEVSSKLNNDDKASEYLQKSLDLREKHLISYRERRSRLWTLVEMSKIFEKRNDESNAKICKQKILKTNEHMATKKLAE
ncbi:unnamed protein product [Didymodactylos carnosus]|uniref:Tetratricopeptide repeat protein n=1 Tax=Didymodactylos carnosus TaxID=1234261 RepID=A0A8S2F2P3_9BILA|nr:unnamed protein product [Didymodactylos carnosus]CAF4187561.1 unnamed protein product [Didymodactylos carnosus]